MNKILLVICCVLICIPSLAKDPRNHDNCSPVGTWYGGSDYKYLITIVPSTGNHFAISSEAVYSQAAWGYTAWTSWSGELVKLNDGRYLAQEISMYTNNTEMQPPPNAFELDAVRGWMEFIDCGTIKFSYDFFGAYFDLNREPFIDPPDVNYLPPGGISETYSRMPTKCPVCGLAAASAKQARQVR